VIFVHGFSGGASQFQTQAKRLAGNGYPADRIEAHEYDSVGVVGNPGAAADVFARLDRRIARLLDQTGADRVDLLAHSLGTALMQQYLNSSPERAATVAHYVNLDGATASAPPGGVPTLAIWGEGDPQRAVAGATNVTFSDQSHTQVVTSRETFAGVYAFFTGRAPRTTEIVPERGRIALSGRVALFPSNAGASGTRLQVYQVNPRTGARTGRRPVAVYDIDETGAFGPFKASGRAYYEFAVVHGSDSTHHLYYEPFVRSDRLVRLLTSRPGEGLGGLADASERHANLTISRQKEWWGDQGASGDSLRIDGTDVLNAAISPRSKRVIGIFAFDDGADGVTNLAAPVPEFFAQPFITGVDVFVPAGQPPDDSVALVSRPRGGRGHIDRLNVPNWPSAQHRISVQFDDWVPARR
jgi:dienelactone hydrolase